MGNASHVDPGKIGVIENLTDVRRVEMANEYPTYPVTISGSEHQREQ